jgi:hypothetical protein
VGKCRWNSHWRINFMSIRVIYHGMSLTILYPPPPQLCCGGIIIHFRSGINLRLFTHSLVLIPALFILFKSFYPLSHNHLSPPLLDADYWEFQNVFWPVSITLNRVEWVSDCCVTPTQQFFSYIMARTS